MQNLINDLMRCDFDLELQFICQQKEKRKRERMPTIDALNSVLERQYKV
jgi:hypothetical protein